MKKITHYILLYTWTIRVYHDSKGNKFWIFNYYSPLAWALLIAWALLFGIVEGCLTAVNVVVNTMKDSLNP